MANILPAVDPTVAFDFRPLIEKVNSGEMTRAEYEEIFRKERLKGNRIGASTAGIIMGESSFTSADLEYYKRKELLKKANTDKEDIKWQFELGHMAEDIIRETFGLKTGFKTGRCDIAYTSSNYPFTFINPDGWAIEEENGVRTLALIEIKTIYINNSDHALAFKKGIVPIDYLMQCQVQMEVCNIDKCYLVVAWGWRDIDQKYFVIERDREFAIEILNEMKKFHNWLNTGIKPIGGFPSSLKAKANSIEELFPFGNKKLPVKKLSSDGALRVTNLEELKEQKETLTKKQKKVLEAVKEYTDLETELKKIDKQISELEVLLKEEIGENVLAEAENKYGDKYRIEFTEANAPKFEAKNKRFLQDMYPEIWKELTKRIPENRKLKVEKIH